MHDRFRAWGLQVALRAQWIVLLAGAFAFVVLWPFVYTAFSLRPWQLTTWTLHHTPHPNFDWLLIPADTTRHIPIDSHRSHLDYIDDHCFVDGAVRCDVSLVDPKDLAPAEHLDALELLTTRNPGKDVVIGGLSDRWRSIVSTTPAHGATLAKYALSVRTMGSSQRRAAFAAYCTTIVYILVCFRRLKLVRSRTGLAVGSVICTIVSCAAVWIPTVSNCPDRPPPLLIPFSVWVAETENLFRLTNAVTRTPRTLSPSRRVSEGLHSVGLSSLRSQSCNVALCLVFAIARPHLLTLAVQIAIALGVSYALHLTFFCAILAIDVRRTELMDLLAERHSQTRLDAFFPVSTDFAATAIIFVFLCICDWGSPSGLKAHDTVSILAQTWRGVSSSALGSIYPDFPNMSDFTVAVLTRNVPMLRDRPLLLRLPILLRQSLSARFLLVFGATMGLTFALVRELTLQADRATPRPKSARFVAVHELPSDETVVRLYKLDGRQMAVAITISGQCHLVRTTGKSCQIPITGRPPQRWAVDQEGSKLVAWQSQTVHVWSLTSQHVRLELKTTIPELESVALIGGRLLALTQTTLVDVVSGERLWTRPVSISCVSLRRTLAYVESDDPRRLWLGLTDRRSIVLQDDIVAMSPADDHQMILLHPRGVTLLYKGTPTYHELDITGTQIVVSMLPKPVIWIDGTPQVPSANVPSLLKGRPTVITATGDRVQIDAADNVVLQRSNGQVLELATGDEPVLLAESIYKERTVHMALQGEPMLALGCTVGYVV